MLTSIEYVITIPGKPATKGSMKCVGRRGRIAHVLVEDHASSEPWRKTVAGWLTRKGPSEPARPGQPLGVEVTFTLPRPQAHYRVKGGKPSGIVKPQHVDAYPTGHNTGDVDKLLRLILDALQDAAVIPDDAAVVDVTTRKRYTLPDPGQPLPEALSIDTTDALPYPGVRIRLYAFT